MLNPKEFDMLIFKKTTELVKEYDFRYDPSVPVPSEDGLADDFFEAGLRLYLETGTYCVNSRRQIKFSESEIKEALKAVQPKATEQQFKKWDKNNDGFLTPNEMPKPDPIAAILKQADANKDGKVTFEELKAVRPKITQEKFDQIDRNKDGVISKDDRTKGAGMKPAPAPAAKISAAPAAKGEFRRRLAAADTDKDGKVSYEEAQKAFPKMTKERFNRLDRNGDGFVSKEDRPARNAAKNEPPEQAAAPAKQ